MEQNTFQVILNQAKKQGKTPFNCQVNLKQTFEMSQKKNEKGLRCFPTAGWKQMCRLCCTAWLHHVGYVTQSSNKQPQFD